MMGDIHGVGYQTKYHSQWYSLDVIFDIWVDIRGEYLEWHMEILTQIFFFIITWVHNFKFKM
jgi:hypothetical protein